MCPAERKRRGCTGKTKFYRASTAYRAIRRYWGKDNPDRPQVYVCMFCGAIHLGHASRGDRDRSQSQVNYRED